MTKRDWKWIVGILIGIIVLLLTYGFWKKDSGLINLISIGSGWVSIALAIVAIIIAVSENVKTGNREIKVDLTLERIVTNTLKMENVLDEIKKYSINTHTGVSELAKVMNESAQHFYKDTPLQKTDESIEMKQIAKEAHTNDMQGSIEVRQKKEEQVYSKSVYKGDVLLANMGTGQGSEQIGERIVVVVQNDIGNRFAPTVTIVPLTKQISEPKLPTHVKVNIFGNTHIALTDQVKTIDKSRIKEFVSQLSSAQQKEVDKALMIQLGMID